MQEIPAPHPLLRLAANLALFALLVPLREERALLPKVIQEILDNETTLGNDDGLRGVRVLDADDGGFAQRVDLFEFRGREVRYWVPVEDLQLVGEFQFFQEP